MGSEGCFPGERRPGCEDDHSPTSSAEVKNELSYTSTPPVPSWLTQGLLYLYLINACSVFYILVGLKASIIYKTLRRDLLIMVIRIRYIRSV
jgi:hypothetical protein